MADSFLLNGEELREPLLYRGCGLDGIYLLNGYALEEHDGERHVSISDVDGLHLAIGRHLVTYRKGLSPKEIRFLRNTMGITQAEMAARLGNNSQSVARWEKGECEIPGTSEKLLRAVFLASLIRPEDLCALKDLLQSRLDALDNRDETQTLPAQFELFDKWEESQAA
ncbi:helix-turn-helix domain-containing protein [Frigidibacter mobilis]|uniref:XRE family transcriptional regulator n=1 Tax=Frigidibacter mobilis TaxID=1335048 RepID=A0A165SH32_9RHOB|nr:helix-turn-helix domain-containing protein [Frigidibacter mobilis]AMY67993.1 XRE family transcriptional regulator [Frigidibacter mobilis]